MVTDLTAALAAADQQYTHVKQTLDMALTEARGMLAKYRGSRSVGNPQPQDRRATGLPGRPQGAI